MEFDVKQQAILKGCFSVNENGAVSLRTVADDGTEYTPAVTPRINRGLEQLLLSAVTVAADGRPAIRLSIIST